MTIQTHAVEKINELQAELRTIAKWFNRTHGGPDISEEWLAEMEPTLRTLTAAMIDRREAVGKQLTEWKKHV